MRLFAGCDYLWTSILHLARFNELAEGCRFWCKTLLGDAETQGLVASGSFENFGKWEELMNKEKGPGRVPIPIARGTFI